MDKHVFLNCVSFVFIFSLTQSDSAHEGLDDDLLIIIMGVRLRTQEPLQCTRLKSRVTRTEDQLEVIRSKCTT